MSLKLNNASDHQQKFSEVAGQIDLNRNNNFNGYADRPVEIKHPNFTKQELNNAVIPDKIGREIRAQKYRLFFFTLLSVIMLIVGAFFTAAGYLWIAKGSQKGDTTSLLMPWYAVQFPGFMIALMAIGAFIFIMTMLEYAQLMTNIKTYKSELLQGNERIPQFLIKSYKGLIARSVYANWICGTLYILMGIAIGVLWAIQAIKGQLHPQEFYTPLLVLYIMLPVLFVIHMTTLINGKYRRGSLDAFYNAEIVGREERKDVAKHANRVCLIIFLIFIAIILFAVAIPYIIVKKKQKKPLLP